MVFSGAELLRGTKSGEMIQRRRTFPSILGNDLSVVTLNCLAPEQGGLKWTLETLLILVKEKSTNVAAGGILYDESRKLVTISTANMEAKS